MENGSKTHFIKNKPKKHANLKCLCCLSATAHTFFFRFPFLAEFATIFFTLRGCSVVEETDVVPSPDSVSSLLFWPLFLSGFMAVVPWSQATSSGGTFGKMASTTSLNTSFPWEGHRLNPKARTLFSPRGSDTLWLSRGTWQAGTPLVALSAMRWSVMCFGLTDLQTSNSLSSFLSKALVTSLIPMANCLLAATSVQPFLRVSSLSASWFTWRSDSGGEAVSCFFFFLHGRNTFSSFFSSPMETRLSVKVFRIKCISSWGSGLHFGVNGDVKEVFVGMYRLFSFFADFPAGAIIPLRKDIFQLKYITLQSSHVGCVWKSLLQSIIMNNKQNCL